MDINRKNRLVSVVIPCFNASSFIEECLDSLKDQSYKNMEIIIVNDRSTDNTLEIINRWKDLHKPSFELIICNLPVNTGFAGALNTGYYLSSGEFIAVNDADDISHPLRLAKQVEFLTHNPDYDLVGSDYSYFMNGENLSTSKKAQWIKYGEAIRETYWKGEHCVCHGTILFRGSLFDEIGGPTRKINGAEDYEFIAKCLNAKKKIENIPDILYYYRKHAEQRSKHFYNGGVE